MSSQVTAFSPDYAEAHRTRALQELAPRSLFSKGREALAVTTDVLSLGRNSTIAASILAGAEFAAKAATAISGMVMAGGFLAFVGGGGIVKVAAGGVQNAYNHGDWEGGFSQMTFGAVGASYSVAGAGMIAAQSATFANAAAVATVSTSILLGSALALYVGVGVYAGHGIVVNHLFQHELNKIGEGHHSQPQQLEAVLQWMLQEVGNAGSEKELQKKWDRFSFRTSEACCRYVREKVNSKLLERVKQGDETAIQEAEFIIREVKRENKKQLVKHWTLMVIAAIGIAAVVCAMLVATGPFSPILMAVAAVIWFLVDSSKIHEKFATACCGKSEIPAPIIQELQPSPQKKSHLSPRWNVEE